MTPSIIIYDDKIEINSVTSLKEFSNTEFNIEINNVLYLIKGQQMDLKEVKNNNTSVIIYGEVLLIKKATKEKEKSFIKRLLS